MFWIGRYQNGNWLTCERKLRAVELLFDDGGKYIFPKRGSVRMANEVISSRTVWVVQLNTGNHQGWHEPIQDSDSLELARSRLAIFLGDCDTLSVNDYPQPAYRSRIVRRTITDYLESE